jgi:P4 family phage/plasmid primase-like protien
MTLSNPDPQTIKLLTTLHRGGQWGYYWTANGEEKVTSWFPAGKLPLVPDSRAVYFGIHPTAEIPTRISKQTGKKIPQKYVRAELKDVAAVNCLFAEFDAKDYDNDKAAALDHLDSLYGRGYPPHVIIDSGGGYHAYWLLREPFIIRSDEDREKIGKLQAAWVDLVGGDPGAKDLARVLRVPGTLNNKYSPARPVKFVMFDASFDCYDLAELAGYLPQAQPQPSSNGNHPEPKAPSRDLGGVILQRALNRSQNRNADCHWMAQQLYWNKFTEGEVRQIVLDYQKRVENSKPGEDPFTEREALRTMESAFNSRPGQPWERKNGKQQPQQNTRPPEPEASPLPLDEPPAAATPQEKQKPVRPTDDELADRFINRYPLTAYGLGEWRRYNAGVWEEIKEAKVSREIIGILQEAKLEGIRPTRNLISSVMGIIQAFITVDDEQWDACHDVIICKNGAFHIPTMTLQPHSPEHYATSRLDFDYTPTAQAPHWAYVLASTIPDASEFLQEYAGLALTTETKHELALWFCGPAGSGKSTIIEGMQAMLGERATLLGLADIERSRFALGDLRGKTLAVASEQPAIYMQATHVLNAIVSGEKIHTERKFKDPIEFTPRVKIIWAMNELPRVPDAGNGLFRRVKVIKFPALAEKDRDPRIKEEIKKEGAGILNWALEGLRRLRARTYFDVPACVKDATTDFQKNNDIPAVFIAEKCVIGPDYRIQSQALYDAYRAWCEGNGHKSASSTSLAGEWERLGFSKYSSNGRVFWKGIGLKLEEPKE